MFSTPTHQSFLATQSPQSDQRSNDTYIMPASPMHRREGSESYRPRIISTIGQRPAVLVSASVTYVGNNEVYAFGGFDQYTDEVYNHVLRLDLNSRSWSLVDNYGDIPGVRMGHTATLWQDDKILIFGGENEHRVYLNDLIIFDVKTAHWTQPEIFGTPPKARARHAATLHDDKLFIVGGLSGHDNSTIMDDFCFLDLKTRTWSRSWRFASRYDHICWVWGQRLWIAGGLIEDMERANELWWLDLSESPLLTGLSSNLSRRSPTSRSVRHRQASNLPSGGSGYAANSSSIQIAQSSHPSRKMPMAPTSIGSISFVSGPNIPSQAMNQNFYAYSSGCLLEFVTPAVSGAQETSLCALQLDRMRWEKLADGRDLFNPSFRWHYCTLNPEGTKAWLLGTPMEALAQAAPHGEGPGEYLSDVLEIDLAKVGLLGNHMVQEASFESSHMPASDTHGTSQFSAIGADLARVFDQPPERGSGTDFIVTAERDDFDEDDTPSDVMIRTPTNPSKPIHVHRLILECRWPHFKRMISAEMAEFHSKKLHIPEPYSVVHAFLLYLYTDSIASTSESGPTLDDVAGMLVLSNCYNMPRLRLLCRNRLGREMDIESAAIIWERAGVAGEDWLRRRASKFCMTHFGHVVRTAGFQSLRKTALVEMCHEIDPEGRVVGAEELEAVGGLGGARIIGHTTRDIRPGRGQPSGLHDDDEDDGMEIS